MSAFNFFRNEKILSKLQASAHFFGKGGAAAPPLKNQGGAISNQGGAKKILHLFTPKFFRRCRQNFCKNCTFWT